MPFKTADSWISHTLNNIHFEQVDSQLICMLNNYYTHVCVIKSPSFGKCSSKLNRGQEFAENTVLYLSLRRETLEFVV